MVDIKKIISSANIVPTLSETQLNDIQSQVYDGYEIDEESRASWLDGTKRAIKLADQTWEQKDFPFKGAANIQYPMLATASIQFAARAYPTFVKKPDVVRALVIGNDPLGQKADKARRISQHMSYQLLHEMPGWEEDTDKMLHELPVIGCAFKKTYYDSVLQRNVSEYRPAIDIVINYYAKSLESAPRITDVFSLYPNEIKRMIRGGLYIDFDFGGPITAQQEDRIVSQRDTQAEHVFLEQHTWFDLDEDGYQEPYIITMHKDTKTVVRMVARFREDDIHEENGKIIWIEPEQYFTKFSFIPSRSIYDVGFGHMLEPINRATNAVLNQIVDSGTMYNLNAGFLGKIQLGRGKGGGVLEFAPNEWKFVNYVGNDLRNNIVPLPVKEPSGVLHSLLAFLVAAGEKFSSVAGVLTGQESANEERPTAVLARIEQGLKVFSSIHTRLYRDFGNEFQKIYRLNHYYLKEQDYYRILDPEIKPQQQMPMLPPGIPPEIAASLMPQAAAGPAPASYAGYRNVPIYREDYDYESCDVLPVADPNITTNTQKMIRAQVWIGMLGRGFNDDEIRKRFADGMQEPEPEKLLTQKESPPNPALIIEQEKLKLERERLQFEVVKFMADEAQRNAKAAALSAQAVKDIATAEAVEPGQQIDLYKTQVKALLDSMKIKQQEIDTSAQVPGGVPPEQSMMGGMNADVQQGGLRGMAGAPGDTGVLPGNAGAPAGNIAPAF